MLGAYNGALVSGMRVCGCEISREKSQLHLIHGGLGYNA
jgi:hypothetical protein